MRFSTIIGKNTPNGGTCMAGNLDLHIHTAASDGSDTPAELAEKVAAAMLDVMDN